MVLRRSAAAALIEAIRDPSSLAKLDAAGWERMLSCARRNAVLAYLGERAWSQGVIDELPEIPRDSLMSARASAARLAQLARWELDRARRVLRAAAIPVIALKGVAYILCVECLTPRRACCRTSTSWFPEAALPRRSRRCSRPDGARPILIRTTNATTAEWSHEIPPLQYPGRLLALDVHHTICPPESRLRPDPEAFWAGSEAYGDSGVRVLSPVDSVLHAAVHLFFDSDFDGRFRDLVDLQELLAAFAADDDFWPMLVARAREQGLGRPLYYALHALPRILGTPVPAVASHAAMAFRPPLPIARWMNRTLAEVLAPIDPQRWPPAHRGRLWLLYVRSHWLRMPAHLLVPHLVRKSLRRGREDALHV